MITQLLIDVVSWVLSAALSALGSVIPPEWLDYVQLASDTLADVMAFAPALLVLSLMALSLAISLALDAYEFIVQTYRLVPAKFT